MVTIILQLIASALSIWDSKLKTKYIDEKIAIEKAYYEEQNKPQPDDAVLDRLEFRLRILAIGVAADIGLTKSANQSGPSGA